MNKNAIITLIVIAIIFSAGAFILLSQNVPQVPPEQNQTNTSTNTTTNSQAGLKTFADGADKFEFKYPDTLVLYNVSGSYNGSNYNAVKLVSAERARNFGKTACRYSQSGMTFVCSPEKEGGIEFAVIQKPVAEIVNNIRRTQNTDVTSVGIETSNKHYQAFFYGMGVEGEGLDQYLLSIAADKTLIITRQYTDQFKPSNDLLKQILETLKIS